MVTAVELGAENVTGPITLLELFSCEGEAASEVAFSPARV
jgi:hypothetical protein